MSIVNHHEIVVGINLNVGQAALDPPHNSWATIMPIDDKIGTEYRTEGMSHCRVGRLAARSAAHVQRDLLLPRVCSQPL